MDWANLLIFGSDISQSYFFLEASESINIMGLRISWEGLDFCLGQMQRHLQNCLFGNKYDCVSSSITESQMPPRPASVQSGLMQLLRAAVLPSNAIV